MSLPSLNFPTLLSLSRGMLCLFFLSESTFWRTFAIVTAALTDFLDGYLARRFNQTTTIGTLLDPLMDKFFVAVALAVFWYEDQLAIWQLVVFFMRDISVLFFSLYLWITDRHKTWKIRSFWAGKVMTSIQFVVLIMLAQNMHVPYVLWAMLVLCGVASFFELIWLSKRSLR